MTRNSLAAWVSYGAMRDGEGFILDHQRRRWRLPGDRGPSAARPPQLRRFGRSAYDLDGDRAGDEAGQFPDMVPANSGAYRRNFTPLQEATALRAAAGLIPSAVPDDDQLILRIPGDGGVASLRRVLGELDDARIDVEHISIHSPDLDDVFFAVTGHATTEPTARQEQEALQR